MNIPDLIAQLSYKPGWEFAYEPKESDHPAHYDSMAVTAQVQHSQHPECAVRFKMRRAIPEAIDTTEQFLLWVKQVVVEAEYHEVCEFLRFGGELVADPHKAVAA